MTNKHRHLLQPTSFLVPRGYVRTLRQTIFPSPPRLKTLAPLPKGSAKFHFYESRPLKGTSHNTTMGNHRYSRYKNAISYGGRNYAPEPGITVATRPRASGEAKPNSRESPFKTDTSLLCVCLGEKKPTLRKWAGTCGGCRPLSLSFIQLFTGSDPV
jgi:hypothetical protein